MYVSELNFVQVGAYFGVRRQRNVILCTAFTVVTVLCKSFPNRIVATGRSRLGDSRIPLQEVFL